MDWGAGSERPLAYRLGTDGEPEPMDLTDDGRWTRGGDPYRDPRRRIGSDYVDGYLVSTVFLVVDHAFDGGPPVLWETMVSSSAMRRDERYYERYTSREDAAQGHARVVAALLEGKTPEDLSADG